MPISMERSTIFRIDHGPEQFAPLADPGIVVRVVFIQQRTRKAIEQITGSFVLRGRDRMLHRPQRLQAGESAYRQHFHARILDGGDRRLLPFVERLVGEIVPGKNDVCRGMRRCGAKDSGAGETRDAVLYEIVIGSGQMDNAILHKRHMPFAPLKILGGRLENKIAVPQRPHIDADAALNFVETGFVAPPAQFGRRAQGDRARRPFSVPTTRVKADFMAGSARGAASYRLHPA